MSCISQPGGKEGQQFQTDRLPHLPIGLIITPLLEIPLVLYCQQQNSDSFVCIQECKPPSSSETLAPGMLHVGCPLSRAVVSLSMVIYPYVASVMEKAMAPHSSTLAWKITWTEEPGGLQSMGSLESDTTERLHFHFSLSCIGEGNGNPLQCSCLVTNRWENSETMTDFILGGYKITADGDCSHEIKRCLLLGWKGFPAFPAHLRMMLVSRGNSR